MRHFLSLVSLLVIAACTSHKQLAFNRYTIDTPFDDNIPYEEAIARLTREAGKTCAAGYRKINDYDTSVKGKKVIVWEISCEGVERAEAVSAHTRPRGW